MSSGLAISLSFALLAANAFFVASEFALLAARRSEIENLPSRISKITLRAMENITLYMTSAQLGITVCTVGLGAISEPALAHIIEDYLLHSVPEFFSHALAIFLALSVIVFLHVILGEMVPKNLAIAKPKRVALLLVIPLQIFTYLLYPVIYLLNKSANAILWLAGIQTKEELSSSFSQEEISNLIAESKDAGYLDDLEANLLAGALQFETKNALSIVIGEPKSISRKSLDQEKIITLVQETGFSRIPIQNADGSFTEYIHIKDLLCYQRIIKRPILKINADISLRKVVEKMQTSGAHLASVYSKDTLLGIITLEDAQRTLVGEIRTFSS